MTTWQEAILQAIESQGGRAALWEIFAVIANFRELSEEDFSKTKSRGEPAYEHRVRCHLPQNQVRSFKPG